MSKLPPGVKLVNTHSSQGYDVVVNGTTIGCVYARERSYNIAPKGFVLRWWEAKLPNVSYPLGVDLARLKPGDSLRDHATKFNTRTEALNALLSPPLLHSQELLD